MAQYTVAVTGHKGTESEKFLTESRSTQGAMIEVLSQGAFQGLSPDLDLNVVVTIGSADRDQISDHFTGTIAELLRTRAAQSEAPQAASV